MDAASVAFVGGSTRNRDWAVPLTLSEKDESRTEQHGKAAEHV